MSAKQSASQDNHRDASSELATNTQKHANQNFPKTSLPTQLRTLLASLPAAHHCRRATFRRPRIMGASSEHHPESWEHRQRAPPRHVPPPMDHGSIVRASPPPHHLTTPVEPSASAATQRRHPPPRQAHEYGLNAPRDRAATAR